MKPTVPVVFLVLLTTVFHGPALARRCTGRGTCPSGKECLRRKLCVTPLYTPLPAANFYHISEIQGRATLSPFNGQTVSTIGVVTAINARTTPVSLWIQDIYEDSHPLTSEGIYLFRPNFPSTSPAPLVGDVLAIEGPVAEFVRSNRPDDLPITEILFGDALIVKPGAAIAVLPIRFKPRAPLTSFGDGSGYAPDASTRRVDIVTTNYSCASVPESAICYCEAHEHMLVSISRPQTVTPELRFGEIGVASRSPRCGSCCPVNAVVSRNTFRPEVLTVEDDLVSKGDRNLDLGQPLNPFQAIVFYSFSQYKLYNIEPLEKDGPTVVTEPTACPAKTTSPGTVRIASWNLENRDPKDPADELDTIGDIVAKLHRCPDVIGLSEIGDNDPKSGVTSANDTLTDIADAFNKACGISSYEFSDIAPLDLSGGGLPGENIRVALLFRGDKVRLVDGVPKGGVEDAVAYDQAAKRLTLNPGRISPTLFPDSRKLLAAEFEFVSGRRQSFTVVVNHWNSKFVDGALFGREQPPLQASLEERRKQAAAVSSFVDTIPRRKPLLVVGDLNDFYFADTVQSLGLLNLWRGLPKSERFSFLFQSRLQTLDHILVRKSSARCRKLCAVHSSTFSSEGEALRATDHDGLVAVCQLRR